MGAILTKLRAKKVPAIEAAPEVKEETETATGDIPSTQELPSKTAENNEIPIKVENVKLEETEHSNDKTVEPTVTEFERIKETKIEKEKSIKDTGETTEKTVFTEVSESVRVEEAKGPIADPTKKEKSKSIFPSFSSKDSLSFMSETSSSRPTSTVSQTSSEVYHPITKEEKQTQSVPPKPDLFGSFVKTEESSAEVLDDGTANVNEAVVKIQAGVRGYLTRKSLKVKKEKTEGEPESLLVDVGPAELDEPLLPTDSSLDDLLKHGVDIRNSQLTDEELSWLQEGAGLKDDEQQAATKIQAAFRGYMVRKDTPSK